jgi:hypothetical protein
LQFNLADLTVEIAGTDPVSNVVRRWLDPYAGPDSKADLNLQIALRSSRRVSGRAGPLTWQVSSKGEPNAPAFLATGMLRHRLGLLPAPLYRVTHPGHLSQVEHLASTFMSEVFVGITQAHGLSRGQCYLPAAVATRGGRTIAIMGPGASGKSGSILRLCWNDGWRYLSDDMALVQASGLVELSPKPVEVAARNLAGDESLKSRLLRDRSLLDRFAWAAHERFRNGRGLRRIGSAIELLGADRVGSPQRLTDLIVLQRVNTSVVVVEDIGRDRAVEQAARLLGEELKHSAYRQTVEAGHGGLVGTASGAYGVIQKALTGVRIFEILIPATMAEADAEDEILRLVRSSGIES